MGAVFLAVLLAFTGACSRPAPEPEKKAMGQDAGFDVLKNGKKVEWIKNAPGAIISKGTLPPDVKPLTHPFLTSQSFDAFEEDNLRQIMEKARSFDDYVALLKKGGYTVSQTKQEP